LLHQVGDLFELNVKLRCQKVKSRNHQAVSLTFHGTAKIQAQKTTNVPERWKKTAWQVCGEHGRKTLQ
jgi:hypothetical protein